MYQFQSRVRYSETDQDGGLSVTGIINYFQDCTTFHSEDLGVGVRYLEEHHRAWLLSSWQIIIDRYPRLGEEIVIATWPYDFRGIYGWRNFFIKNKVGEYLVRANSTWFMFDLLSGRPTRPAPDHLKAYGAPEPKMPMEYAPRKIVLPEEYTEGEAVQVSRHHLDSNHHVNNAQYVEIAREFLPDGFRIAELRAEYRKSAVLGDWMTPRISRTEEGCTVALCAESGSPYAVVWLREQK